MWESEVVGYYKEILSFDTAGLLYIWSKSIHKNCEKLSQDKPQNKEGTLTHDPMPSHRAIVYH